MQLQVGGAGKHFGNQALTNPDFCGNIREVGIGGKGLLSVFESCCLIDSSALIAIHDIVVANRTGKPGIYALQGLCRSSTNP